MSTSSSICFLVLPVLIGTRIEHWDPSDQTTPPFSQKEKLLSRENIGRTPTRRALGPLLGPQGRRKDSEGTTGCDFLPPPAPSVPALPDDLRKDKTFFAANDQPALEVGHRWALHILRTFDLSERPRLGFKGRGTLPAMQKNGIVVENSLNRAFRQFDGRLWCWLQARSFFSAQRMATIQRL